MDAHEIARRASELPARFATRVPPETLKGLRLMEEGGEYGELAVELTATLAQAHAAVTAAEQQELRDLLVAMDMPASPADQLEVQG
jgi:hypothetical protein